MGRAQGPRGGDGAKEQEKGGPRSCQPAGGAKGLLRFEAPETECPGGLVPTARRHRASWGVPRCGVMLVEKAVVSSELSQARFLI